MNETYQNELQQEINFLFEELACREKLPLHEKLVTQKNIPA